MGSPESLNPSSVMRFYTSHKSVRDMAIHLVNNIGRTNMYAGIFAVEVELDNPIGVEPKFIFDVDAKDYVKSIKSSLRILLPILELEYKALGSNERFNETVAWLTLKVRTGVENGQKVERTIIEWLREKRKKQKKAKQQDQE